MSTNDWSAPETDVFERIRTVIDEGTDAALATVVAVEGSAYRRPGAKMVIEASGGGAGSITAGCLEDEIRELAADIIAAGEPRVETWDLTGDDDVWGMGVGCNGVITVLLEPLDESFRSVAAARERGENVAVATVVGGDLPIGTRSVFDPDSGFQGGDLPEWLRDEVSQAAERLVASGAGESLTVEAEDGTADVFVDGIRGPPELVVFGSGHDIGPVVELAKLVDFRVTVVSFRGAQARTEQFPRADAVASSSPRDVADLREWDDDSYAVIMTHNFIDDSVTLEGLLDTAVPYIGLMGPRERFDSMRDALTADGRTLTEPERDRIYTPIGLSLGGDAPYQIAYSIVAELLAVTNGRTPEHLSQRKGPIHDPVDETSDQIQE